jgi:chemotaxis signal transduction protein
VSEATSEILLFQVGARVFAAPVHDVRRIGSRRDAGELVDDSVLGAPFRRVHGLVVESAADHPERTFVVDGVIGIRSVPVDSLQPLPAFAAVCLQSAAVKGYVLIDDAPTLLVDLKTLVREPSAAYATERH